MIKCSIHLMYKFKKIKKIKNKLTLIIIKMIIIVIFKIMINYENKYE